MTDLTELDCLSLAWHKFTHAGLPLGTILPGPCRFAVMVHHSELNSEPRYYLTEIEARLAGVVLGQFGFGCVRLLHAEPVHELDVIRVRIAGG